MQDTATQAITSSYLDEADRFGAHHYHPLPVVLERGEGVWVRDVEGRRYLDMLSAYSALNQGHLHPRIIGAARDQMQRLTLTSRAFHNDQMGPFQRELCELTGFERVLLMNTGAEGVETAIKMVRKWGYQVKGIPADRAEIIVCDNNFHGRTTTIVGFSSELEYRRGFGPFTPGFRRIPYGDIDALRDAVNECTAGFLVEPIQGEGGVIVPPDGYLRAARDLCSRHQVALVADEIQTGLGRTGRLLCCDWEDVRPDVLILGKALGGGVYPVSAAIADSEFMDVFRPGEHGSTFGGNPLAAAVARVAGGPRRGRAGRALRPAGRLVRAEAARHRLPARRGSARSRSDDRPCRQTVVGSGASLLRGPVAPGHPGQGDARAGHSLRAPPGNRAGRTRLGSGSGGGGALDLNRVGLRVGRGRTARPPHHPISPFREVSTCSASPSPSRTCSICS